jgi:hypothetical protein
MMNKRMIARLLVLAVIASVAWNAVAEEKYRKLKGPQIRARFSGMELTDDVHWYDFYDRNGTILSSSMGRKRQGKWWIEKDQLCIDVDKESSVRCYDVLASGNNVHDPEFEGRSRCRFRAALQR